MPHACVPSQKPVLVTGAGGFVGFAMVQELRARGKEVTALVRNARDAQAVAGVGARPVIGDVFHDASLEQAFSPRPQAVVQLIGLKSHVNATERVLANAARFGVRRYMHLSALGAEPDARARYHKKKWQAEEHIRAAPVDWTIFQPSVIFGEQCDFIKILEILVRIPAVTPMLGSGQCRIQPIHVRDVARVVSDALVDPEAIGKAYHLGGPDALSMDEVLTLLERRAGKKKLRQHLPLNSGRIIIAAQHSLLLGWLLRRMYGDITPERWLNADHLELLLEDNICRSSKVFKANGIAMTTLAAWLSSG